MVEDKREKITGRDSKIQTKRWKLREITIENRKKEKPKPRDGKELVTRHIHTQNSSMEDQ